MKKISKKIITMFKSNLYKFIIVILFFLIGIIWGISSGVASSSTSDGENIVNNFIYTYNINGITSDNLFFNAFFSNLRLLLLIWISGLTIYLIPLTPCCNILKGFGIGYTISYLMCESGTNGLLFSIISLVFQNVIVLPALFIYSVYQINYTNYMRKISSLPSGYKQCKKMRCKNIIVFFIGIIICMISAIVETGIVPMLIKVFYGNVA